MESRQLSNSPPTPGLAAFAREFFSGSGPKVLMGDFNLPAVDWVSFLGGGGSVNEFLEILIDENVSQVVDGFTRFGRNQNPSLLDLCFVQNHVLPSVDYLPPLGKSDHAVLKFVFNSRPLATSSTFRRLWNRANFLKINESLSDIDWEKLFRNKSIEEAWSSFQKVVWESIDKYVPQVLIRKENQSAPWFGKRCKLACRSKARAWKRYQFSGNPNLLSLYLSARRNCSKIILQERRNFESSLGFKIRENPICFWSYVNRTLSTRPGINSIENQGKVLGNDAEIADAFSEYFASVFVAEPSGALPTPPTWPGRSILSEFCSPDIEDIVKEIDTLKTGKSCGPDNLTAEFLKGTKEVIALPLKLLFEIISILLCFVLSGNDPWSVPFINQDQNQLFLILDP